MAQLTPYLFFKGNCREAMAFYKECLDGKLNVQTVGDSPMAANMPQELHNSVMHSVLEKDGFVLMASDMILEGDRVNGNTVSLCLLCKSKDEIQTLYSKLSAGGTADHPLNETFFGTFGDLTDKYGFNWMLQMDAPKP